MTDESFFRSDSAFFSSDESRSKKQKTDGGRVSPCRTNRQNRFSSAKNSLGLATPNPATALQSSDFPNGKCGRAATPSHGKDGAYKFHPTDECMVYLKSEVEKMCRENGLHQVELNKNAKQKITTREYWAQHRGQEKFDQKNENIRSIGGKPTETTFQTELSRIRSAIDDTKQKCNSVQDFKAILKRDHNIEVTESRGRWSYLPEYRKKPITSRRLGDDYSKESIATFINQRILEQQTQAKPVEKKVEKKPKPEPLPSHPVIASVTFGRIIDLNDPKIQASYNLTQWAKIQNLKNMSLSFNYLTEHHLLNMDDLRTTIDDLRSDYSKDTQVLVKTELSQHRSEGADSDRSDGHPEESGV